MVRWTEASSHQMGVGNAELSMWIYPWPLTDHNKSSNILSKFKIPFVFFAIQNLTPS